jgi:hypothetical protein
MTYTAQDVDDAIMDRENWSEVGYMDKEEVFALLLDKRAVLARKKDNSRLGEGATDIWVVIEIEDKLYRKSGYHQSHDGTYWDGPVVEVRAQEKLVTVYERI